MHNIIFKIEGGEGVSISAAPGENLLGLARKANVAIDAPCSGNGSCGKCRVRVIEGAVRAQESRHIGGAEYSGGWRLACECEVTEDAVILVPDIASAYKGRLRVTDMSSPEELRVFEELQIELRNAGLMSGSGYGSATVRMDAPTLDDTMPDNERLKRAVAAATGAGPVNLSFGVLRRLPDILRDNGFSVRCVYYTDSEGMVTVLDADGADSAAATNVKSAVGNQKAGRFPDDRTATGVNSAVGGQEAGRPAGLAIDIGTTTVSVLLVDLESGHVIARGSSGNGQIRYGADVINRIIEQGKPGGVRRLQSAVVDETLVPIIERICEESGVPANRIYAINIASNTTMNHLLLGVNAEFLRTEPYIPAFFETEPFPASTIAISAAPDAKITLAPNIGSYVGGDVTAGCLASMMWNREELSLLVDLGTNGEIVFGNSEFLMACACSAGPAFEGGDIKCGMRATDGAIEACEIDADTMEPSLTVFGGGGPIGVCGSGIIDIIAELFRRGIINGKGKFTREGGRVATDEYGVGRYILASAEDSPTGREVYIDETDIDNFIRAKGAIFSAIMSMTDSLGFSPLDIARIYVAGGIGSGINIANAVRIGMFPDLPQEVYSYIGNSALNGAYAALMSRAAADKLSELARSITYVELSAHPGYMDQFVAACFLPHTDGTLFRGEA